ncbi:HELP domain-containing protein, partial [Wuchereria bancrofti]
MKKWLSSADVKYSKGGRRNSRDHLMKDSKVGTSTTNLSYSKSIRLELREPSFLREKGVLQVFVNGKTMYLPVPNSVNNLDLTCELDAPTCEPKLNWVYGYRGKDKLSLQNQETNIKMPYIRMKKWLSSADVKYSKGGRRNSRDHLMKDSKVGTSTTNLSYSKSI